MNTKTSIKNLKNLLFIITFICGIISIIKVTYADADFSYKVVKNEITGPITGNAYEYEICLDALMYHINILYQFIICNFSPLSPILILFI